MARIRAIGGDIGGKSGEHLSREEKFGSSPMACTMTTLV